MKKVVAICLFGDEGSVDRYGRYLPAFVRAFVNIFHRDGGWTLKVFASESLRGAKYGKLLQGYQSHGLLEVEFLVEDPYTKAMLWRMKPVFDTEVDVVFCRDLDCLPMPRDRACCDVFINAKQCVVHTVHDNPMHVTIMGGLCGFRTTAFRRVTGIGTWEHLCQLGGNWLVKGADQNVLNAITLQVNGPTLLEHRYAGWSGAQPKVFPARAAGHYPCQAFSTLVPDQGFDLFYNEQLTAAADRLANHLGAAGFDHEKAEAFWNEWGAPDFNAAINSAEKGLR